MENNIILNKSEFIEAFSHLRKIEIAIVNNDKFRLAILLTQLKYKYNLRLELTDMKIEQEVRV